MTASETPYYQVAVADLDRGSGAALLIQEPHVLVDTLTRWNRHVLLSRVWAAMIFWIDCEVVTLQ